MSLADSSVHRVSKKKAVPEIKKSIRNDENIELRQYYYGEKIPPSCSGSRPLKRKKINRSKSESEMDIPVQCTACPKLFKKNSEIISHLYEHIEIDDTGTCFVQQRKQPLRPSSLRCHICMKKTTMGSISGHVKNSHEMKNHPFTCRICELYYENKQELVNHMHSIHPCLDMPYCCAVCGYKTSFRTLIFKHFEELHPKNYVLCNFCLTILSVKSSEEMKNVEAHLMEHVGSKPIKCTCCALRFTCNQNYLDHLRHNHERHCDSTPIENIKLYKLAKGEDPIFMLTPSNKNPRRTRRASSVLPTASVSSPNSYSPQEHKTEDTGCDDEVQIVYEKPSSHQDGLAPPGASTGCLGNLSRRCKRPVPKEFLEALDLCRCCDAPTRSRTKTSK